MDSEEDLDKKLREARDLLKGKASRADVKDARDLIDDVIHEFAKASIHREFHAAKMKRTMGSVSFVAMGGTPTGGTVAVSRQAASPGWQQFCTIYGTEVAALHAALDAWLDLHGPYVCRVCGYSIDEHPTIIAGQCDDCYLENIEDIVDGLE